MRRECRGALRVQASRRRGLLALYLMLSVSIGSFADKCSALFLGWGACMHSFLAAKPCGGVVISVSLCPSTEHNNAWLENNWLLLQNTTEREGSRPTQAAA